MLSGRAASDRRSIIAARISLSSKRKGDWREARGRMGSSQRARKPGNGTRIPGRAASDRRSIIAARISLSKERNPAWRDARGTRGSRGRLGNRGRGQGEAISK